MENSLNIVPLDLGKSFTTAPPPLDFVLPGLLSGTVGALVGTGGNGKSMWALEAAFLVAGGPDLLGIRDIDAKWKQTTGQVVYIAAEDPEILLVHRVHNMGSMLSPEEREHVQNKLTILPVNGMSVDIMADVWRNIFFSIAEGTRLFIIDTLRRVHQLDENDSGAMAGLMGELESICRLTGTTILFLHHSSKAGAMSGEATATRGSSVLTDNARLQINLVTMSSNEIKTHKISEENRKRFVRQVYAKTNYCAPYADQLYRRGHGGILEPYEPQYPKKGVHNVYSS